MRTPATSRMVLSLARLSGLCVLLGMAALTTGCGAPASSSASTGRARKTTEAAFLPSERGVQRCSGNLLQGVAVAVIG